MRPAGDRARDPGPSRGAIQPGMTGTQGAALAAPAGPPLTLPAGPRRRLERLGRVAATGLAFAVFGFGALLLALTVFPFCRVMAGSRNAANDRVQHVIQRVFRAFLRVARGLGLIRTRWIGLESLRAPGAKLIVANHPTLIDVVQLVAELPQADCVVNDARTRNPFLGLAARAAGYLTNARGVELVEACAARLRAGRTVILFPEGSRTPEDGVLSFRRGAAHVALAAGVALQPVSIRCHPRILMKGRPFWDVPERTPEFTLRVLEPLDPRTVAGAEAPRGIAARRITDRLRRQLAESGA